MISLLGLFLLQAHLGDGEIFNMPPGAPGASPVTEAQLEEVRAHAELLGGGGIHVLTDWKNPYFGAFAQRNDGVNSITIWGGLARNPGMTYGALVFVACHELGHHLGGAPYQTLPFVEWSSSEGQSDTFAGQCLDAYLTQFGEKEFSEPKTEALQACQGQRRCALITEAAWEFLESSQYIAQNPVEISPLHPDATVASETLINLYPSLQCRLDTVRAAAQGSARPACWFR